MFLVLVGTRDSSIESYLNRNPRETVRSRIEVKSGSTEKRFVTRQLFRAQKYGTENDQLLSKIDRCESEISELVQVNQVHR